MKTMYKVLGIFAVAVSLFTGTLLMTAFHKNADTFRSGWNYWILQSSELGLMIIALLFAVLLFHPNFRMTSRLLWATVIILIVSLCASVNVNYSLGGFAYGILSIITGIAVILAGFFSSLLDKDEESLFYQDFRSKLDL